MSHDSQVATLPYESCSLATPLCGGTTTRALLRAIYENTASQSFVVPPPAGRRWWRSHQRGGCFSHARQGGCMVFINWRRSRPPQPSRPKAVSNLSPFRTLGPKGRQPSRPQGVSIKPLERQRTQPLAPRAGRPDGCHTPLCAESAGPYGNTGKHRPADWYLMPSISLTILTEILRFVETLQRVSKSAEVGP